MGGFRYKSWSAKNVSTPWPNCCGGNGPWLRGVWPNGPNGLKVGATRKGGRQEKVGLSQPARQCRNRPSLQPITAERIARPDVAV